MEEFNLNDIFKKENRNRWRELVEPYIINVDINERYTTVNDDEDMDFCSHYPFIPEELDPNYQWPFEIGDIVTDGKDIMKIVAYPALDPRSNEVYDPGFILEYGNKYSIIRIDKEGNDTEIEDPWAYLHQMFNINEIHLASQEEIDRLLK